MGSRGTWFVSAVVGGLCLLFIAECLELLRTDTVAAVQCVPELLGQHERPLSVVHRYRDAIASEAERADLPPELLGAIIADHHGALTPFRRFTDCVGSALGGNLSLGPAQIRLSTAVRADGADYDSLAPADFKRYRALLLSPLTNIRYQAMELRRLLDRDNRSPGMGADELIRSPVTMALLITEYRVGRLPTSADPDIRRSSAVSTLRFMHNHDLYMFGRSGDDVIEIRRQLEIYLTSMNCESRNSDATVCEEWKQFLSSPAGDR